MAKSPSGFPQPPPYGSIANRQAEIMMRIASEFGFTPASRSRISTPSPSERTLFDIIERGSDRAENCEAWNVRFSSVGSIGHPE